VPDGLLADGTEGSALAELLSARAGKVVRVRTPRRGAAADALKMADDNAAELLRTTVQGAGSRGRALAGIQALLGLDAPPHRIEGFDMSTFQSAEPVGSMVVITDGRIDKRAYRHYSVKGDDSRGDTGFMREVLTRRLSRLDDGAERPDLIMLDGGPSQIRVAREVLASLGLDIPVVGLAKSRVIDGAPGAAVHSPERLFVPATSTAPDSPGLRADERPYFGDPADEFTDDARLIVPGQNDPGLHLLMRLRDEAHRFAIGYHRKLRDRRGLASVLDGIPGLGKVRRTALLRHFKAVSAIRGATLDELLAAPGIPHDVAARLFERMHGPS